MWNSVKAHDEWFKQYYDRYDKFIQGLKRELVENTDYSFIENVASPAGGARKQHQKNQYLISYDGLKQLEMKCDK